MKMIAMTTLFITKISTQALTPRSISQWDTDSGLICIDNRCSSCMSHNHADFIGEFHEFNRTIKGFDGTTHYNAHIGTLKWYWEDDQGKVHKFLIPKSYYVPEGGVRLLSPQH